MCRIPGLQRSDTDSSVSLFHLFLSLCLSVVFKAANILHPHAPSKKQAGQENPGSDL